MLALMGFFYVPLNGSDLGRINLIMHLYTGFSWSEVINEMMTSSTPLAIMYYKLVGSLGDDRLLPFITAIITYALCFAIMKCCYEKYSLNKNELALVFFIFMSRGLLMMTIANIRTMLSLAIISFSVYKILIESKSLVRHIPFMVVGSLLHVVGLLTTLLFILYYFLYGIKKRSIFINIIELFGIVVLVFAYGYRFIQSAAEKGQLYIDSANSGTGFFYIWEMVLSCLSLAITVYCLIIYRRQKMYALKCNNYDIDKFKNNDPFIKYIVFILILDILLFIIEFNSGFRLSWHMTIMNIPLISLTRSYYKSSQQYNILLIIGLISLFLACARGDLCSLKFI
ncbi:MAG: EpsG family protein [Lachnospiraceae bacterium]|nr:EpsG family protein [Lachnospiraceae bacterium]